LGNKDPDILTKIKFLKKMIYEKEFAKSIERDEPEKLLDVNWQEISVPDSYDGPKLQDEVVISSEWYLRL